MIELPYDGDAERSILASLLLDASLSVDGLSTEDFYDPKHQHVYAAMRAVHGDGFDADSVTVADRLRRDGLLDLVGGVDTLRDLETLTPSMSAFDQHVGIVQRHSRHRRLVLDADRLGRAALSGDDVTVGALIDALSGERVAPGSADPSFEPVDMAAVLAGDLVPIEPSILRRDDGLCLFYSGQVNGVHGDSGAGKGWLVLYAVAQQLAAGRVVLVVDTEDVAESIALRLRRLGAIDDAIADRLLYVRPTAPFDGAAIRRLVGLVEDRRVSLTVLDSLGECFGLDGVDEDRDAEVGPWLRRIARRLADAGCAVVIVDHSTKAKDNPLHPSGSKRKRAAIGGASYFADAVVPFTRDDGGRLRIICAKDRHGNFGRSEHVADLVMTVDPAGCRTNLYAPDPVAVSAELPIILAARAAVAAVKAESAPVSFRVLEASMSISTASNTKRAGIDLAVSRGALAESTGPRKARMFSYVGEFPDDDGSDA